MLFLAPLNIDLVRAVITVHCQAKEDIKGDTCIVNETLPGLLGYIDRRGQAPR